jgi:uncharacterized protein (TIGR03437 family)
MKSLFYSLISLLLGSGSAVMAQQTSIIPVTDTVNSNGAFVRGASNDGQRLVFESSNDYTGENKDGNNEIFVYDADLRRIIQLTKTGSQAGSGGAGGGQKLNGRNCPGGCEPASFTPVNAVPAISGDGTHIVFASSSGLLTATPNIDGNVEIYLATLPRGAAVAMLERLTETEGAKDSFDNNTPAINYDGSIIAFVTTRRFFKLNGVQIFSAVNQDSNAQIMLYEAAAHRFTQVTHKTVAEGMAGFEAKGFISNPFLSGNGQVLAFLSGYNFSGTSAVNNADLNGEIFVFHVGDPLNQVTQVTNTTSQAAVPEDGAVNVLSRFSKHFSDDGSLLVFESAGGTSPAKTGERIRDVFLYNLKTQGFTQITAQDVGKRDLSDYNYFPSLNGAGTFVAFSSKLNLPVINDSAGNFNNSRELYRYDLAAKQFFLVTQTELSQETNDQRLVLFAPFISDDGASIGFSNNGNLLAARFNSTAEVFQARLRPALREANQPATLANAASFATEVIARGSLVTAFGSAVASTQAASGEVDNYPFELAGVSVTVGDSLSGIAGRVISVAPGQVNFVMPTGLAADDEVAFIINNNGVLARGTINIRDAAPGLFSLNGTSTGAAQARCRQLSEDGQETIEAPLPCTLGFAGALNQLVLYGTGWRYQPDLSVRFRFTLANGEEDEVELVPLSVQPYLDTDGKEHLGLDEIVVSFAEELAGYQNVDTKVLLTSNGESQISQDGITTAFGEIQEDLSVINAASQESGPLARGSIAIALVQNDDDETDIFTEQTLTASPLHPPLELGGLRVKVGGVAARVFSVSPDQVKFLVPANLEAAESVLVQVSNAQQTFNTRVQLQDAAPGVFTETGDGDGPLAGRCGLILPNGAIEFTAPPCALSAAGERRILVLTGTGWRFASGVKVTFDGTDLLPSFAGAEPGQPGVDRLEIALTADLAESIAGKEKDLVVQTTINNAVVTSQTGATLAFQAVTIEELRPAKQRRARPRRALAR